MRHTFHVNGLLTVTVFLVGAFLTSTSLADAEVQRTEGKEEEVSEEGVVTYDEKAPNELEQHECTFFYKGRYPRPESQLINCTWYTQKACCKRTEVTSVFAAMDPIYGASVQCRNYINYLMCYFCSPDQYKFYQTNMKAMVCLDYCESLYEECKTAGFQKTLIGEEYSNGTAFCAANNFDVTDNPNCFKFDPNAFNQACKTSLWSLRNLYLIVGFNWLLILKSDHLVRLL